MPPFAILLLRRWRVVVASLVICVAASVVAAELQTPQYQSTVQLFVSTQGAAATSDSVLNAYEGGQFTTARVQSYVELISSPEIVGPVIRRLGLTMSEKRLAGSLSANAPTNTVLINISAKNPNARLAQRIASAVGSQYIRVIKHLETTPRTPAPVRVSVSAPATLNTSPVSPDKKLDVALGIILGLLIGVGAAQLLDRLDDTISSERELSEDFDLRVLARVPWDPNAAEGIAALGQSTAVGRLEALRGLRTALRYVDVDNPPRCIVVTSCDPGVGKSVTTTTLSAVIADAGNDVIVLEGDLRRPRLREYMGGVHSSEGVAEILAGGRLPADAAVNIDRKFASAGAGKLDLISSGAMIPNPSELVGSNRMRLLIEALCESYDTVIIDAPPLLPVTDAALLARLADGVIVVVEYNSTPRHGLRHALDSLQQVGARVLGAVVNKTTSGGGYGYGYGYGYQQDPATGGVVLADPKSDRATTSDALSSGSSV